MTINSGVRLGPYEILSPLGAGGMGEVYRARDVRVDRAVALKVLPEEFFESEERRQRFEREARMLASLNHPGIAHLYSFEEIPSLSSSSSSSSSTRHVLVMELVEGEGLDQKISSRSLSLEESLSVSRQISEALEAAHEKGIVHRDLKPANVKITPDGRVKLLDFGLAKIFESEATVSNPSISYSPTLTARGTAAGVILGTAAYMSPEQARGKPVDKRSDVWAFGCVLYEMLAGKKAFEGETVSDTLAAILRGEPDWAALPELTPAKIRDLLRRCLRREAKQRLHDIADARIELEEALAPPQGSAGAAGTGTFTFEEKLANPSPTVASAERASRERGSKKSLSVYLPWALAAAFAAAAGALALNARAPRVPAPVSRFEIRPPEGQSYGNSFALSPDGRTLALVATDEKGIDHLFVRPFEALQAQELPGTEGARFPFWSPDSKSIGFFANDRLLRISASGGPPQTLCTAGDGRGGAWSPEGVILFAPGTRAPLHRVSASGGLSAPITKLAPGDFTHRWPKFLPDGKHFLFLSLSDESGRGGVSLASLDQPKETLVVASRGRPDFGAGRLLFVRDETLFSEPFDPATGKLSGEPLPLADGIAPEGDSGWTGLAAFSCADDGTLVYRRRAALRQQLTWMDRSGKILGVVGEPAVLAEPSATWDITRVVLSLVDKRSELSDIWQVDVARGAWSRLTFGPKAAVTPVLSPDGEWLVYSSNAKGRMNLYRKRLGGTTAAEEILETGSEKYPDTVSPDGKWLVYEVGNANGRVELWRVALEGARTPEPLVVMPASSAAHACFSPDGRYLAYTSDETGRAEVYVQTFPPSGGKWQVSTAGGDQAQWKSDGREVYYVGADRRMMVTAVREGRGLEIEAPRTLFPVRLSANGIQDSRNQFVAAADGQRFLVLLQVDTHDDAPAVVVLNGLAGAGR